MYARFGYLPLSNAMGIVLPRRQVLPVYARFGYLPVSNAMGIVLPTLPGKFSHSSLIYSCLGIFYMCDQKHTSPRCLSPSAEDIDFQCGFSAPDQKTELGSQLADWLELMLRAQSTTKD